MLVYFNININEYVTWRTKNPRYPRKPRKMYIYIYTHSTSRKIIRLTSYIKISTSCDVIKCLGNTDLPCPYPCLDNPASRVRASFRDGFPRENHRKKIVRGAFGFPLPFLLFFFSFFFILYNSVLPPDLRSTNIHPHNGNKAPNKRFPSRWTERTGKSDISMPSCPPSSCFYPLLPPPLHQPLSCSKASGASFYGPPFFPSLLFPFPLCTLSLISTHQERRYAFEHP